MKIIDNFLPLPEFKNLQSFMMGDRFDWYYNTRSIYGRFKGPSQFQFTHTFYHTTPPWNGETRTYDVIAPCVEQLKVKRLYRAKANLLTKTMFHKTTGFHVDLDFPCTTAVFYLNSCNGYTKFKKGPKVKSVANRIVIFDSQIQHSGFTCTDENTRVVVNFNYEGN